jgi:hypothetical protein
MPMRGRRPNAETGSTRHRPAPDLGPRDRRATSDARRPRTSVGARRSAGVRHGPSAFRLRARLGDRKGVSGAEARQQDTASLPPHQRGRAVCVRRFGDPGRFALFPWFQSRSPGRQWPPPAYDLNSPRTVPVPLVIPRPLEPRPGAPRWRGSYWTSYWTPNFYRHEPSGPRSLAPAQIGKPPRKILRPRDGLLADHPLIGVAWHKDREHHRPLRPIELDRHDHQCLRVARRRAVPGDLRIDLDHHIAGPLTMRGRALDAISPAPAAGARSSRRSVRAFRPSS